MGLDLYIEARIREKKTGKIITPQKDDKYAEEESDKGFFEMCWWCGWDNVDIRERMIEISNKHAGTDYTDEDDIIPVPQTALREICKYLFSRSCLLEDEKLYDEILGLNVYSHDRDSYEHMNLFNAQKLLGFIQYRDYYPKETDWYEEACKSFISEICEKNISDKNDFKLFEKNPQAYEWEFRIFNSY